VQVTAIMCRRRPVTAVTCHRDHVTAAVRTLLMAVNFAKFTVVLLLESKCLFIKKVSKSSIILKSVLNLATGLTSLHLKF